MGRKESNQRNKHPCCIRLLHMVVSVHTFCKFGFHSITTAPQTHNVQTTSYSRRCDAITSHRREYDVVLTFCVYWETPLHAILLDYGSDKANQRKPPREDLFRHYVTNIFLDRALQYCYTGFVGGFIIFCWQNSQTGFSRCDSMHLYV